MSIQFRTSVVPDARPGLVRHDAPLLTLGSCFADNIGERLRADGFAIAVNPLGTLYNPLSILASLKALAPDADMRLFEHDGLWHSWLHHSRFSAPRPDEVRDKILHARAVTRHALTCCSAVFITLGTAWVYESNADGIVVANCHKVPAREFSRRLITLEEAVRALIEIVALVRSVNSACAIIFTVSPIRHLADGAHGNQVSKSTLLLAIDTAIARLADNGVGYYPAYEIMMDDLRDYRFYADDLKHPSEMAINYIYHLFGQAYFTDDTARLAKAKNKETRAAAHRKILP